MSVGCCVACCAHGRHRAAVRGEGDLDNVFVVLWAQGVRSPWAQYVHRALGSPDEIGRQALDPGKRKMPYSGGTTCTWRRIVSDACEVLGASTRCQQQDPASRPGTMHSQVSRCSTPFDSSSSTRPPPRPTPMKKHGKKKDQQNCPAESPEEHSNPDRSPIVQWRRSGLSWGFHEPRVSPSALRLSFGPFLCQP
jgi:hypothetical protein